MVILHDVLLHKRNNQFLETNVAKRVYLESPSVFINFYRKSSIGT